MSSVFLKHFLYFLRTCDAFSLAGRQKQSEESEQIASLCHLLVELGIFISLLKAFFVSNEKPGVVTSTSLSTTSWGIR